MNFKIGDLVTRNSYNNDIVFKIINISDSIAYLKGTNIRLYADSKLDDLKIYDKQERKKFLDWLWDFEFNLYGLPVPSEVFFLNMPVEKSIELMKNRENKFTHEQKKDIHESNEEYLKEIYKASCDLAEKYNWHRIECVKNDSIRTIDDIHNEIFDTLKSFI